MSLLLLLLLSEARRKSEAREREFRPFLSSALPFEKKITTFSDFLFPSFHLPPNPRPPALPARFPTLLQCAPPCRRPRRGEWWRDKRFQGERKDTRIENNRAASGDAPLLRSHLSLSAPPSSSFSHSPTHSLLQFRSRNNAVSRCLPRSGPSPRPSPPRDAPKLALPLAAAPRSSSPPPSRPRRSRSARAARRSRSRRHT